MDPNNPNSSAPTVATNPTPQTPNASPLPDLTAPPNPPSLEPQAPSSLPNPYDPPAPPANQPPQPGAISSPTPTPNPWDIPVNPPSGPAPITPSSTQTPTMDTFSPPATPFPESPSPEPLNTPESSWSQLPSAMPEQPTQSPPVGESPTPAPAENSVYSSTPSQPSSNNFNNYPSETLPPTPAPAPVFDQTAADPSQGQTNTLSDLGIGGLPQTPAPSAPEPSTPLVDPLHSEPAEPAPTDLSQLSGMGTPAEPLSTPSAPAPTPTETVTIPPAETSTQHEKTHKFPKILLFGGIAVILLVVLLSVYLFFIRGSSTPAPSSLPAQTTSDQLPLTNPPAPITQQAPQPLAATGSANTQGTNGFGSFTPNGATDSAAPAHQSAFEAAKAREAAASQSAATSTP